MPCGEARFEDADAAFSVACPQGWCVKQRKVTSQGITAKGIRPLGTKHIITFWPQSERIPNPCHIAFSSSKKATLPEKDFSAFIARMFSPERIRRVHNNPKLEIATLPDLVTEGKKQAHMLRISGADGFVKISAYIEEAATVSQLSLYMQAVKGSGATLPGEYESAFQETVRSYRALR